MHNTGARSVTQQLYASPTVFAANRARLGGDIVPTLYHFGALTAHDAPLAKYGRNDAEPAAAKSDKPCTVLCSPPNTSSAATATVCTAVCTIANRLRGRTNAIVCTRPFHDSCRANPSNTYGGCTPASSS